MNLTCVPGTSGLSLIVKLNDAAFGNIVCCPCIRQTCVKMCLCSLVKSPVLAVLKNHPDFYNSSRFIFTTGIKLIEKMAWEQEKLKYLYMPGEQKRKDCYKWQDIPTWKEFAQLKGLSPKINALPENIIDSSKNNALADKVAIFPSDITRLEVDAIVNAANKTLLGGGGVDGAIHRAAGSYLKLECETLGGCETGKAKITGGYKLASKYVIHTVGPVGEKPSLLKNCYVNSLELATSNNLRTIAFPCISTGVYEYPNEAAAHVAAYAVRKYLEQHADAIDRVIFCLFLDIDKTIYEGILQSYFPIK